MYKINIVCVGSLKENFYKLAEAEFLKRLSRFCEVNVIERAENLLPKNPSEKDITLSLEREYVDLLPYLKGKVVVMDSGGKGYSSVEFKELLFETFNNFDMVTFVIGSSYGLSKKIKQGNSCISFSKMTFPHNLIRIMLEEQIYRAFTIQNNITYHK